MWSLAFTGPHVTPAVQSTSDIVVFAIDFFMYPKAPPPQPIQWQKMMLLSALRAECAFLFLKILSVPSSADSQRKERVMAAEGWETPLFDTISTQCSLSLPFAAEPDDYQSGFIHTASTLN